MSDDKTQSGRHGEPSDRHNAPERSGSTGHAAGTRALIGDLVSDLRPVRGPGRVGPSALLWLAAALIYSITIMLATGPMRPDAVAHLHEHPSFGVETLLAFGTIVAFAVATLMLSIPGRGLPRRLLAVPLLLFAAWISFYVVGIWHPAHPVSMIGKREHCLWQGLLFSLPNLFMLLAFARRFYPMWPRATAAAAGFAGGAVPAALMQFGCMYVPGHILTHHIAPIFVSAAIGAIAGPLILKQRRTVPRGRDAPLH